MLPFCKNATGTIFAGVISATKSASMAINFVGKYSRTAASANKTLVGIIFFLK